MLDVRGVQWMLRPKPAALSVSGFSVIDAVNALMLKRLRMPAQTPVPTGAEEPSGSSEHRLSAAR